MSQGPGKEKPGCCSVPRCSLSRWVDGFYIYATVGVVFLVGTVLHLIAGYPSKTRWSIFQFTLTCIVQRGSYWHLLLPLPSNGRREYLVKVIGGSSVVSVDHHVDSAANIPYASSSKYLKRVLHLNPPLASQGPGKEIPGCCLVPRCSLSRWVDGFYIYATVGVVFLVGSVLH